MQMQKAAGWMLALLALYTIAGCSGASDDLSTGADAATVKKVLAKEAQLAATMVLAVKGSDDPTPVRVRFELAQRPEVDRPTEIKLAFIPTSALDRLYARFEATDGLELLKGVETEQFARPLIGEPLTHSVTVMPKKDGIFYIQATVLMDSQSESLSRVFSVPLIAGSGLAEWAPKKVAGKANDPG